jgi:hypothetical protein
LSDSFQVSTHIVHDIEFFHFFKPITTNTKSKALSKERHTVITGSMSEPVSEYVFKVEVHNRVAGNSFNLIEYFEVILTDHIESNINPSHDLIPHPSEDGSTVMVYCPSRACALRMSTQNTLHHLHLPQYPSLEHLLFSTDIWSGVLRDIPTLTDILSNIGCVKTITLLIARNLAVPLSIPDTPLRVEDIYLDPPSVGSDPIKFSIAAENIASRNYGLSQQKVDEITRQICARPDRSDFQWPVVRYAYASYGAQLYHEEEPFSAEAPNRLRQETDDGISEEALNEEWQLNVGGSTGGRGTARRRERRRNVDGSTGYAIRGGSTGVAIRGGIARRRIRPNRNMVFETYNVLPHDGGSDLEMELEEEIWGEPGHVSGDEAPDSVS